MGIAYVAIALIVILLNSQHIPGMFSLIFKDAFDFTSIFGGVAGSCMVYGIKRGLFSNEAGVGSAPNASASANVSHPAKQGLVQTLSVYIDTLLLCTATAFIDVLVHWSTNKFSRFRSPICTECNRKRIWMDRSNFHHSCNGALCIYHLDWKSLLRRQCPDFLERQNQAFRKIHESVPFILRTRCLYSILRTRCLYRSYNHHGRRLGYGRHHHGGHDPHQPACLCASR